MHAGLGRQVTCVPRQPRPGRAGLSGDGGGTARLAAYREPAFFNIVNYEQVLGDAPDINEVLRPDVIILDEAQRIKNWQIKTARQVKSLRSLYAFVLTGTPVENRIDELYSIVQYLDPELIGPLFRFNRDFYDLDARGRPVDYKNLAGLRRRLQPVMLRRRKCDVEAELPGRTVKNYFVPMAEEQALRYADYSRQAAALLAQVKRRPLTPKEFERLQMLLACMRMICDTPAILDPSCRVSPKLEELEGVLSDLLGDRTKIIVFSEWERMLGLVRELAAELGVDAAWHTGSVPQQHRRAEILRFKQDPACRLFLSTDSGSVGLNLQVASAVVNVDLPWNPAKLEQRIARAWRKNQTRSVTVVNLVCENSIEHQILHLLGRKQALADGVLDGQGDLGALKMPSGRAAMIERIEAMMRTPAAAAPRILAPEEAITEELRRRHGERVSLVEARRLRWSCPPAGRGRSFNRRARCRGQAARVAPRARPGRRGDRPSHVAGNEAFGCERLDCARRRRAPRAASIARADRRLTFDPQAQAAELRSAAERSLRMARVLAAGGFPEEAMPLIAKAVRAGAAARLAELGDLAAGVSAATPAQIRDLVSRGLLLPQAEAVLSALPALQPTGGTSDVAKLTSLIEMGALAIADDSGTSTKLAA